MSAGEPVVLNARGLLCPLPVLRAQKLLKALPTGALLRVEATDPGAVRDFDAFCEATGNRLVKSTIEEGLFTFLIERTR